MKHLPLALLCLALVSCAHHKDVRPGAEGVHRVLVRGSERDRAERKAIDEANHYCDKVEGEKHAAFVTEKTDYSGSMDENTRRTVKQASTAAMVLGNTGSSPIGAAGTAGYMMTDGNDFTSDMTFRCK